MFSRADKENCEDFTIQVEEAVVARLLILSLSGQEVDWQSSPYDLLQMVKLRSYFGLDIDVESLLSIKIPSKYFPLFIEVVSLPEIKIDKRLMIAVERNAPSNYGLKFGWILREMWEINFGAPLTKSFFLCC